ncbi:3-hydroxyisobutyrate dehydrogenase [Neorhizobium alkalisoli]|uniref:3-hydroxyisobutyrate dehydrogenase n=1 Tax=Neorhizobium alkalisoli TaxID=528178 RepID=A0A561QRD3_9HYPH|nr:3-hydroxyisobutyrate dehydrogenase [Neorhizobium alkalisoli]
MKTERIGIIGLGRMGQAMATRFSRLGFSVSGWSRSGIDPALAEEIGMHRAVDIPALVAASDIVILALLDDQAVHTVLDALATVDLSGRLVVDTSTVSPQTLRGRAAGMEAAGARLLDAPISGGPEMLLSGKVGLYIGGDKADFDRFLPLAETLSDRIHHAGGLGDGAAAKLVNNMMLMGQWQNLKEALILGKKAGLTSAKILEILSGSPAASPAFKSRLPVILGETDAVGFPVSGAIKDGRLVRDVASVLGIDTPAMAASLKSFEAAAEAGFGDADLATMVRLVAERSE